MGQGSAGGGGGGGSSYTDADAILAVLDGTENFIPRFGASGDPLIDSIMEQEDSQIVFHQTGGTAVSILDRELITLQGILGADLKVKFNLGIDQEAGLYFETTEPTTGSFRYGGTGFRFMPSGTTQTVKFYSNGNVGLGDMIAPTYALSLSGQAAKTIGMERHTTSDTAGNDLSILSGGATSGATDKKGGDLYFKTGASTGTGTAAFYWQGAAAGGTGTSTNSISTVMTLTGAGNLGLGTTTPTNILSLSGQAARTIWMERHQTANTAGNDLNIQAGGSTVSATNGAGGNLYLKSGQSTGSSISYIYFQTPTTNGSSTADGTMATRVTISNAGLGIGKTPTYAVDVAGTLNLDEGGLFRVAGNKFIHYTHSTLTSVTGANTFIGYLAGNAIAGSAGNTMIGASAGYLITTGANHVIIGAGAGLNLTTASFTTMIGTDAGSDTSGAGNVFIGRRAGQKVSTGTYNVFIGNDTAAVYGSGVTGSYNVGIGFSAGLHMSGGSAFNIGIGLEAGGLTSGVNYQHSAAIGAYSKFTASKQIVIGGAGNAYVYTDFLLGSNDNPTELTSEYDLTIRVGQSYFNSRADMGGNNLIIQAGVSTGNGSAGIGTPKTGDLIFKTTNITSTGTTINTFGQRMVVKGATGYIGLQDITAPTSFLHIAASTTAASSLRIPGGVAPSSPNDGDVYYIDTNDRLMFFKNATASEILSASAVTTETVVSDTTLTITYNGTSYKILCRA